jgi:AcrR family transcriptional regulator
VAHVSPKDSVKRARTELYRGLILDSAEAEFAARGYDDAKMQDIAQGAGIALGTLYSVFPGKAEVYDAIQERRGREILEQIASAIQGFDNFLEAALRGVDAYVRCLVARPNYLRMHLREGLSWTDRAVLRSSQQVATWERGMRLAVSLIEKGIERGFLYADNPPELQMKMMIAAHQTQLRDWVDRGADPAEIGALIQRMQDHFRRALVQSADPRARRRARS